MAAAFDQLFTAASTDVNATELDSSSFAVSSGTTLLASLFTRAEQANEVTFTGGGLTWTKVLESISSGASFGGHMQTYRAHANAASTVTVNSSFDAGGSMALGVITYTGGDSSTVVGNSSLARNTGNTQSISVPASTGTDSSISASIIGAGDPWSSSNTPTGFTFRGSVGSGGQSSRKAGWSVADHVVTTAANDSHTWSSDGTFRVPTNVITVEVLEGGAAPPAITKIVRNLMTMGVGRLSP